MKNISTNQDMGFVPKMVRVFQLMANLARKVMINHMFFSATQFLVKTPLMKTYLSQERKG
jgi:hypothetical protein